MEVRQRMKLTGTNSSIGLIVLITQCPPAMAEPKDQKYLCTSFDALRQPGGYGEVSKPDPIPNSVVKRFSADGTVPQGPEE